MEKIDAVNKFVKYLFKFEDYHCTGFLLPTLNIKVRY